MYKSFELTLPYFRNFTTSILFMSTKKYQVGIYQVGKVPVPLKADALK